MAWKTWEIWHNYRLIDYKKGMFKYRVCDVDYCSLKKLIVGDL